MSKRFFPSLIAIISFIGFLDAAYLTAKHFIGGTIPCMVVHGCDVVTNSAYSTIAGIPIALLGALFYLTVFIAAIMVLDSGSRLAQKFINLVALFGFLFSIWLIYVQAFILKAFCSYCLISATTSTLLFIATLFWQRQKNHKKRS